MALNLSHVKPLTLCLVGIILVGKVVISSASVDDFRSQALQCEIKNLWCRCLNTYLGGKRASESLESRRSPPPMNIRTPEKSSVGCRPLGGSRISNSGVIGLMKGERGSGGDSALVKWVKCDAFESLAAGSI
ncbi:hypothetical protein EVAR_28145_1 [Eumeta japonica]|uniref:Uncharacterized protein n=1 Tax=Eumeta variegata TaxID=151549 RepID=A0A4C1VFP9_EUMVA|nr:hypothetical protein EVAR_28145_1 [Eumeta japonica]